MDREGAISVILNGYKGIIHELVHVVAAYEDEETNCRWRHEAQTVAEHKLWQQSCDMQEILKCAGSCSWLV